jgi:hypothetical protein
METMGITSIGYNIFPLCPEPNLSFNVDFLSVPQRAAYSASGCCSPIWVRLKNNDRKATINAGGTVRSSQYLRAQAQLYFDIARLLSERKAAEEALATAAKYLAQAEEMEQAERISSERAMAG